MQTLLRRVAIVLTLIFLILPTNTQAASFKVRIDKKHTTVHDVNITIDDKAVSPVHRPYIHNSRTYVPVRTVAENMGAKVQWDQKTESVTISRDTDSIRIAIDQNTGIKNGQPVKLPSDSIPKLVRYPDGEDKTMVPLRLVSELLGYDVQWNGNTRTAIINKPGPAIQGKITGVTVDTVDGKKAYRIQGVNGCEYKSFTLSNPFRYVIDIENSSFYNGSNTITVNESIGFAKALRINEYKAANTHPNTVRIVLDGNGTGSAKVQKDDKDLLIFPEESLTTTDQTISRENQNGTTPPPKEEVVLKPRPVPGSRQDVVIVLDPGHGGKDPGAVNRDKNVREVDIIRPVTTKLEAKLKQNGYNVVLTNPNFATMSTWDRAKRANETDGHVFLSIHANSTRNDTTEGIETFYAPRDTVKTKYDAQYPFASSVHKELIKATDAVNRGLKSGPRLIVVRETQMPAALVEVGFISSKEEVELLTTPSYQDTIVDGLYRGITQFIRAEFGY